MTETAEHPTTPTRAADPAPDRPNRLYQGLAWVGIVAGVVFIVAVVFFSGFIIGKHSGGGPGSGDTTVHRVHLFHRGGPPRMGPMGPVGPIGQWPGPGGQIWPGGPGVPPTPSTTPPSTPRP